MIRNWAVSRSAAMLVLSGSIISGCGPNRAQWMASAAHQQTSEATQSIGKPQEVRAEAAQGSAWLNNLASVITANPPNGNQQTALAIAHDAAEVSTGLQDIAASQTDAQFTNAVFGLCTTARKEACPRIGHLLLAIAGAVQSHPPLPDSSEQDKAQFVSYFQTFGQRLIAIPDKCEQASAAMAEASAEEQQAEAEHRENVNHALAISAVIFASTALAMGEVGAAAATRPPVQNNYVYVNQANY
jgi:hypothetical protein